jgi:16S rRNA processing protein RimM
MSPEAPLEGERWVPLAVVARPHGVRGEVRLRPYNADSDLLLDAPEVVLRHPGGATRAVAFEWVRRAHDAFLAKLEGLDDRDDVEALRGAEVLVRRLDFPPLEPGEFYVCDVVGAKVVGPDGEIGTVADVVSYPTVESLVVAPPGAGKGTFEIPLIEGFIEDVDADAGIVRVTADGAERAFA